MDLLGFGPSDLASIERTFREIAAVEADDGMVFNHTSLKIQEICKEAGYVGATLQPHSTVEACRFLSICQLV